MKIIHGIIIILMITFATSCVKQTIVAKPNTKVYLTESIDSCRYVDYKKTHYLFWGLLHIGEGPEVLYKSGETIRVETETTFVDGLVSIITLGIYSTRTSDVYRCNIK